MSGRVLVLCGPPGSGKGVVSRTASDRGMTVLSLGNEVRAEVAARGLDESPENVGKTAVSMREEYGEDIVVVRLLGRIEEALADTDVLIDGMRQPEEMESLKQHIPNVMVLAVSASETVRLDWLSSRGRGEDGSIDDFSERERREWGWGLDVLMSQADAIIINDGSLNQLSNRSDEILESLGF